MKNKAFKVLAVLCMLSFASCSQNNKPVEKESPAIAKEKVKKEPHQYGGWYCPDNLYGFPAVNIADWDKVPVVNGRMATEEEIKSEASLINVDMEKYPNAKPLDITMPKLATYYNRSVGREDLVIVIQALNIDNDSIVGFRYLNGGNGSAHLNEVTFLSYNEIEMMPKTKFVSHTIEIKNTQQKIWEIIHYTENAAALQPTFDKENKLPKQWRKTTNVNYHYPTPGRLLSAYANKLYGCYYIQNDYDVMDYSEKILLVEDEETGITKLKISCGPYADDFETQNTNLLAWAQKVKELSEK